MIVIALFMFIFIVFALGFLYFWGINPGEVTVFLTSDLSYTLPTTIMLICVLLLGLLIGNGVHIFSAFLLSFRNWKGGRRQKKAEEISSIYRSGVGRLLSGDLKKARTLLQKAVDRDPQRVDSHLALASVALQEGNTQEGIDLLQKARDLDPKGLEVLFKLATTFEEAGRLEEAMGIYKELLSSDGDNRKAMRALRDIQMDLGAWQEALELQKKIIKVSSGPKADTEKTTLLHLRYEVARQNFENGERDLAIETCRDIIKKDAGFTPARVTLGDAYRQAGRNEEAVRIYQDGYKALKKSVFLARLEDHYLHAEDPAALLAFYRSQMQADAEDLLLKLYLGRLCLRLEMVDEAMQHLTDLETSNVEFTKLHLLLAEAQRRRNHIEEAVSEYQKALGIDHHLRLGFVCESCNAKFSEWHSRCPECKTWDSLVLPERKQIQDAKLLEEPKMIPHGAREE
ncbi:MAG: tetratricopeptide repeat protein [Desulfuromonadales bacterium]|nr:tetratricopeptide repeat protein [Desulfuromonadales bacterium]MBN2791701.1 tetratricopeptide repeat protein [Desulfuromonadales bacterium]